MNEEMLRGVLADRYSAEKVPADLDTIVIGSGMSGLTSAAVLSRMGRRVLVLEQHYVAGGGTHMFQLTGGLKFDSGLHYLVPYAGHLLWLAAGGNEMPVRFERMGEPDGTFDRIAIGADPPFAIKDNEAHLPDLFARFPERRSEIEEYLRVSDSVLKRFPLFVLSKLAEYFRAQKNLAPNHSPSSIKRTTMGQAGTSLQHSSSMTMKVLENS